jgi:hypothetical protein
MVRFLASLWMPAIFGLVATLPFMVLEYLNRRAFHEDYPVSLFIILWLLAAGAAYLAIPLIQEIRAGFNPFRGPSGTRLRVILLALTAVIWFSMVAGQLPCFLGAPVCD